MISSAPTGMQVNGVDIQATNEDLLQDEGGGFIDSGTTFS